MYVLHSFGESVSGPIESIKQAYEDALQSGDAQEMIFVFPDAGNKLWGSLYLNSPTIGDYQTYLTKELVETIDATYRTIPDRASRGVTGCGMGGNGSMGLALKYPKVYGVAVPASGLYDWEHDPFFDLALNSVLRSFRSHYLQEGNWGAVWFLAAAAASARTPTTRRFMRIYPSPVWMARLRS